MKHPDPERADRRRRLLTVGIEAFGSTPYDEVLVSELARSAGVAAGLPFHYFGSKRGYFVAVLDEIRLQMRDVMVAPADRPAADAVREMLRAHLRWLRGHPQQLRELVRGGQTEDAEVRAAFEATRWDGARRILDTLGVPELDDSTRMFVIGWIALKDEVMLSWIDRGGRLGEDALIDSLLAVLIDILRRVGNLEPDAMPAPGPIG